MKIKFMKIHDKAVIPYYSRQGDAGMDLFAVEDYTIKPGERKLIPTGLKVEVPHGFEMQVRPKSGLALNSGITVLNTPGTVDSGYRGELGVILFNVSDKPFEVKQGQKIAQAVFTKFEIVEFEEASELSLSDRGSNGFGSTGLK